MGSRVSVRPRSPSARYGPSERRATTVAVRDGADDDRRPPPAAHRPAKRHCAARRANPTSRLRSSSNASTSAALASSALTQITGLGYDADVVSVVGPVVLSVDVLDPLGDRAPLGGERGGLRGAPSRHGAARVGRRGRRCQCRRQADVTVPTRSSESEARSPGVGDAWRGDPGPARTTPRTGCSSRSHGAPKRTSLSAGSPTETARSHRQERGTTLEADVDTIADPHTAPRALPHRPGE